MGGGNSRSASRSAPTGQVNFEDSEITLTNEPDKNANIWYALTPFDEFDAYGIRAISSKDEIDNSVSYKKMWDEESTKNNGDFFGVLPEEVFPQYIQGDIHLDFQFYAQTNGYMTIYPIFWNTDETHILGVYYTDSDGNLPWIDTDKLANGEIEFKSCETHFIDIWKSKNGTLKYWNGSEWKDPGTAQCSYVVSNGEFNTGSYNDTTNPLPGIQANGIRIKFTQATNFGFYIKVLADDNTTMALNSATSHEDYKHIYFSEGHLNHNYGRILAYNFWDANDSYKLYETFYIRDQITETYTDSGDSGTITYKNSDDNELSKTYASDTQVGTNSATIGFNTAAWGDLNGDKTFWRPSHQLYHKYSKAVYLNDLNVYNYAGDKVRTQSYFCFEDYYNGSDLNDCIFIVKELKLVTVYDGDTPIDGEEFVETDEPFDWIIAAEDLGTTDDFDFNDMVVGFNVENTNNQYTITFTPLAAGGTMPIYLHFEPIGGDDGTTELNIVDGSDITTDGILYPHYLVTNGGTPSKEDCEWHKWFDNGIHSSSTMINTDNGSTSATTLNQCKVTVDGKFSITHYSKVDNGNFKGFYIVVDGNSDTTTDPKNKKDDNNKWIIGAKSDYATAPQMFVIPDNGPSSGKWLWPAERTHILTAYPDFQGWAEVHTNNTDWHLDTGNKGSGRSSRHGTAAYPTASGGS